MSGQIGIGSPYDRELQYYRRECNDLGGRLLRAQEEQSQSALEARRSRTVVRLLREAYRLAEPSQTTHDVGETFLQIVVENTFCDRAALLREEPLGSGRFLVAHAIGGKSIEANETINVPDPPEFYFTSSLRFARPPAGLLDVLRLPFMVWTYDKSSGHALALANRSEGNVSRAFESGDQELIEAALSVYLDILYHKYAEAQLRQAKQTAEEMSRSQARFLEALSQQLRPPVECIADFAQSLVPDPSFATGSEQAQATMKKVVESAHELLRLTGDAMRLATLTQQNLTLDVQWIDLGEMLHRVSRSVSHIGVNYGIELDIILPRREVSICADQHEVHRALQTIVGEAFASALPSSTVRLTAARRGDGALELVVIPLIGTVSTDKNELPVSTSYTHMLPLLTEPGINRLTAARRIVEAHDGIMVVETRPSGGTLTRVMFPACMTRENIDHSSSRP